MGLSAKGSVSTCNDRVALFVAEERRMTLGSLIEIRRNFRKTSYRPMRDTADVPNRWAVNSLIFVGKSRLTER
jgi:hypothetical protein